MNRERLEDHMQRFQKPDGYCLHCQRPANQHHPVGPITITISAPDGEWAAVQAGGVFIRDRS